MCNCTNLEAFVCLILSFLLVVLFNVLEVLAIFVFCESTLLSGVRFQTSLIFLINEEQLTSGLPSVIKYIPLLISLKFTSCISLIFDEFIICK
ncbi:unnamed protein product [Schistosoma mattheei]|uniref:Uncharacterized protein n=1 Tax=Schistosoma mattheei TaxID=31246 RepID=A0A3P8I265_9TREM|nr:unnamed protein product [Schistosoma mattheei]